jgi:hypothetical protein
VTTSTRRSAASSFLAASARSGSISAVISVQSAGISLAIHAAPIPTPVPISPIRPPAHPAASMPRNRPPGSDADGPARAASSRVNGNPTWRARFRARATSGGKSSMPTF